MATTQAQIEGMRAFCAQLKALPQIAEAQVDDWGRHGNFGLHIVPSAPDRHTTRRVRALLAKVLRSQCPGAHVRDIFGPDPVVRVHGANRRRVVGYARDYWCVDVDFQAYDKASNTFS